jgi:hypothetical protein
MSTQSKLIFVYNAKGDVFSELQYIAKDITSSHDDESRCSLCALTHGTFAMRKDWKNYLSNLSIETEFLHRDEFREKYNTKDQLPAIFKKTEDNLSVLVSASRISEVESLTDLKNLLNTKLSEEVRG